MLHALTKTMKLIFYRKSFHLSGDGCDARCEQATVEKRIAEYELTYRSRYSDIDDDMLDSFAKHIMVNLPRSGKPCKNIKA